MHSRRWHVLWACGFLPVCVLLTELGTAVAQGRDALAGTVAEIRFGVVEPPVVAQRDITVRAAVSNQQLEEKPLECSGLAWAGEHLLISSDRHSHIIFVCPVDLDRMIIGTPAPHVLIRNEQQLFEDAECITVRRDAEGVLTVYLTCSLSNDADEQALPKRRHMLRFKLHNTASISTGHPAVLDGSSVRDSIGAYFDVAGIDAYRAFNPTFSGPDKNTYRWGNVEGMCFAPSELGALLGMRNPLLGRYALLVAIEGFSTAFDERNVDELHLTDMFALDLVDRGISDLCWDPLTRGYLIAAAKSNGPKLNKDQPYPPNTLDSTLFWWSGRKSESPVLFARLPDMKVEAICRLGPTSFIAVGSDEGDVSEGRTQQQQSVITIMYFTGIEAGQGDDEDS